ncbi:unnamed protein product [Caenorhabditis sp. 36 PRJEB53466]|nr:unnamed protein product [Caenorhabditis sp. 36 PRJEB53466]
MLLNYKIPKKSSVDRAKASSSDNSEISAGMGCLQTPTQNQTSVSASSSSNLTNVPLDCNATTWRVYSQQKTNGEPTDTYTYRLSKNRQKRQKMSHITKYEKEKVEEWKKMGLHPKGSVDRLHLSHVLQIENYKITGQYTGRNRVEPEGNQKQSKQRLPHLKKEDHQEVIRYFAQIGFWPRGTVDREHFRKNYFEHVRKDQFDGICRRAQRKFSRSTQRLTDGLEKGKKAKRSVQ